MRARRFSMLHLLSCFTQQGQGASWYNLNDTNCLFPLSTKTHEPPLCDELVRQHTLITSKGQGMKSEASKDQPFTRAQMFGEQGTLHGNLRVECGLAKKPDFWLPSFSFRMLRWQYPMNNWPVNKMVSSVLGLFVGVAAKHYPLLLCRHDKK